MDKKKILGLIPVSDETYCKWQQTKRKAGRLAGPFFAGATIGATWFAYVQSIRNARDIERLRKCRDGLSDCVNNNARCSMYDRERIETLERQSNLLMEKALNITEGKEEKPE